MNRHMKPRGRSAALSAAAVLTLSSTIALAEGATEDQSTKQGAGQQASPQGTSGQAGSSVPGQQTQGQMQQHTGTQQGQVSQSSEPAQPMKEQTIRGVIEKLDLRESQLSLRPTEEGAAKQALTMEARPFDLVGLKVGDSIQARYTDHNGTLWFVPRGGFEKEPPKSASISEVNRLSGTISNIDRERGMVSVQGRDLRAHPEQVSKLIPGQYVSLSYAQVGESPWVAQVSTGETRAEKRAEQKEEKKVEKEEQKIEKEQKKLEQEEQKLEQEQGKTTPMP